MEVTTGLERAVVVQNLKDLMDPAPFDAAALKRNAPELVERLDPGNPQGALEKLWSITDELAGSLNTKEKLYVLTAQAALAFTDLRDNVTERLADTYYSLSKDVRAKETLSGARQGRRWAYKGFELVADYVVNELHQRSAFAYLSVSTTDDGAMTLNIELKRDAEMDELRIWHWDDGAHEDAQLTLVRADEPELSTVVTIPASTAGVFRMVRIHWNGEILPSYVFTIGDVHRGEVGYSVTGANALIMWAWDND